MFQNNSADIGSNVKWEAKAYNGLLSLGNWENKRSRDKKERSARRTGEGHRTKKSAWNTECEVNKGVNMCIYSR